MSQLAIWSPPFFHMSGGIRALHVLARELMDRGVDVTVSGDGPYGVPRMTGDHHPVALYPEIIHENAFRAERPIWWLLNKQPGLGGERWAWAPGMGDFPLLTVDVIEPGLFRDRGETRNGVVWWLGKGHTPGEGVIPEDATQIHRSWPAERWELASVLNGAEYMISMDPFSSINLEATLCGCPVLIYPDGKWSRAEVESSGFGGAGFAWSPDELETAYDTVGKAQEEYGWLRQLFSERIDNFAETL